MGEFKLISTARKIPTIVVAPDNAPQKWKEEIKESGATLMSCELHEGRIALPELLDDLNARGIQSLMVEGGAKVAQNFIDENLVDEITIHLGGEPQLPNNEDEMVYAPFNPKNLPEGFKLCQELTFGVDKSLRYKRV